MIKQSIGIIGLMGCLIQAHAINLQQSIELALLHNFEIKEKEYIKEEKNALNNSSYSAFLPSVDLEYSYERRDKTIVNQNNDDSIGSATISYNLFNGFSDMASLWGTNYEYKASIYNYEARKQDIVLNTKVAYLTILKEQKNVQTQKDALTLFDKQYEDAYHKFEQGLIAKNDLLEVEVQMLQAKQMLLSAKKDLKVARLSLNNILSNHLPFDEVLEELSYEEVSLDFYQKNFLEKRSEVQALKMVMQSYNAQKNSALGSFLPSIDASLSHIEYGESEKLDGKAGYPNDQEVIKVTAKWNLFAGGKDVNEVIVYNQKKKQIYAQLENIKLQIQLQYEQVLEELDVAKLNYESASKALQQANINYEIVNNRFIQGISKSSDLIDANFLLSQAKQNFYTAYYDKFLAIATLQRVVESKQ